MTGMQEILAERARRLARPVLKEGGERAIALVSFALGKETYAVPAEAVAGVFRLTDLAPLPGAPSLIAGVTAWRGRFVTVLDPRALLGLPPAGLDDRVWVVVVTGEGRIRGLFAGTVDGVREWPAESLEEVDGGHPAIAARTTDAVLVLNIDRLLADQAPSGSR